MSATSATAIGTADTDAQLAAAAAAEDAADDEQYDNADFHEWLAVLTRVLLTDPADRVTAIGFPVPPLLQLIAAYVAVPFAGVTVEFIGADMSTALHAAA